MTLEELRRLTPVDIRKLTDRQARSAYSQLRKGFIKQLQRLESAGYTRDLTSSDIRSLTSLDPSKVKTELIELAKSSRQEMYSLSKINRGIRETAKWLKARGVKNVTFERAKAFGEFMDKIKDSGINSASKHKRYMTALDAAMEGVNNQSNLDDLFDAFDEYSELQAAGVDMSGFENGEIFGIPLTEAVRHKKALAKYSTELEAISNDPNYKKPRSSKDVDNLLRRARRRSH